MLASIWLVYIQTVPQAKIDKHLACLIKQKKFFFHLRVCVLFSILVKFIQKLCEGEILKLQREKCLLSNLDGQCDIFEIYLTWRDDIIMTLFSR